MNLQEKMYRLNSLIKSFGLSLLFLIFCVNSYTQSAQVTYAVRTENITSYEGELVDLTYCGCREVGVEEYSAFVFAHDDTEPSDVGSTGCQTCDNDGDCSYAGGIMLLQKTNTSNIITSTLKAWEDDIGDRCEYDPDDIAGFKDKCHVESSASFPFRLLSATNSVFEAGPEWILYRNSCIEFKVVPQHSWKLQFTWKYSGSENLITPSCEIQSVAYGEDLIPSWSVNLKANVRYVFNNCALNSTDAEDSRIRVYDSDGYSILKSSSGDCDGNASITFKPEISGIYYIELTHEFRKLMKKPGTLKYYIAEPTNNNCSNAITVKSDTALAFYTTCSTQDAPAQTCGPSVYGHNDVWYKFTAASSGTIVIGTCEMADYDTRISVYSGNCGDLALLGCNDDGCSLTKSILTMTICKDIVYYISLGGFDSDHGTGMLSLELTPGNSPPIISCPSNITSNNTLNTCSKTVSYSTPVGTDNCPGASTILSNGIISGESFPVGTTTNTYKVTDADGVTATCSFVVTIYDTQIPTITCPSNISLVSCVPTIATYTMPTGSDNCDGMSFIQTEGISSGNIFPIGTTINKFKSKDASGNFSGTCSFSITITLPDPPVITCPASFTVNTSPNVCKNNLVGYSLPSVTIVNCTTTLNQITGKSSGSDFNIGTTTNTYQVTDAIGRTATCTFTVTVEDKQKPDISCPANITMDADPVSCSKIVNYSSPIATDNCFTPVVEKMNGLASGALFPLGPTLNVFKATDSYGNTSSCTFTITLIDNTKPSISCPATKTHTLVAGSCGPIAKASVALGSPVTSDNCVIISSVTNDAPSAFPLGPTNVIWTATDPKGNTSTCIQLVKILTGNCKTPIQVYHIDTTTTTAKVKWKAQSGTCANGGQYELRIRYELSAGVWSEWTAWVNKNTSILEHQFTGLSSGKFYQYQIRTICSSLQTSSSINDWFHTLAGGPPPLKKQITNEVFENASFETAKIEPNEMNILPMNFFLVPNPSNNYTELHIQGFEKSNKEIVMYDLSGKLIFRIQIAADQNNLGLDLETLNVHSGIYLIRISDGNNQKTNELIIER